MTAKTTFEEPAAPLAPADPHPVSRYVSSLTTAVSRSTARTSLDMAARILSDGACEAMTLPWVQIRREHVLRFRRIVAERYARVTANRMLSTVRGVLRECWRSGELSGETLQHCLGEISECWRISSCSSNYCSGLKVFVSTHANGRRRPAGSWTDA
jgi:hypothetical protein